MSSTLSPNMNLIVPAVGSEQGPDYAFDINSSLGIIDQHTHAPGSGVPITPSAMNINAALNINSNFLTNIAGLTLIAQGSTPAINTIYENGVDLYFVDGLGNNIRITQSGAVAGTPGSISNLVAPASASYVAINSTFVFQSNASIAANLDAGALLMRNLTPNSTFALTLQPPAALSANYSVTLPTLPATTSLLVMDNTGVISTQAINQLVPPGSISMYGGVSAPSGYLLCDGSSVSRTTYANLFGAIGTAYGTADGASFNVPDFRGQFPRGVDMGHGVDPDAASRSANYPGGNTGDNVGSYQNQAFQSHTHTDAGHGHSFTGSTVGLSVALGGTAIMQVAGSTAVSTGNANIQATGGNETRPVNVYVTFIIKT